MKNRKQNSAKKPVKQGADAKQPEPNKISASTPYDFKGKNLTAYGGLLPVSTMLEKLGMQALLEELITASRIPRAMPIAKFVMAIVLSIYLGFSRLSHIRFIAKDPLLTAILQVAKVPPQSTMWRFLASLHITVGKQLLKLQRRLRERVWAAANVRLKTLTIDTDTTVHTLYGKQMGGRKSYNPKNKGKKSYQPILTFLNETREYVGGQLRNGHRLTGKQIADHLDEVFAGFAATGAKRFGRADSGFYCREAIKAYQKWNCRFVVVARKTAALLRQLRGADWKPSPNSDADAECEFRYRPDEWTQEFRFVGLRYDEVEDDEEGDEDPVEQYQLFACGKVKYRVFVTDIEDQPADWIAWFSNQRARCENLIKESNNDAGLTAHPSGRFATNAVHFQLAMLAYNLNCWLLLFQRHEEETVEDLKHTMLATSRLRFLFIPAKMWKHAGRTGISYSENYEEKGLFDRLMGRLRAVVLPGERFAPVVPVALE